MNFEEKSFSEKILDLCTRATKMFVPVDLPDAIVSVSMSCHRDFPKVNQVWFTMVDGGGHIPNKTLDLHSLQEQDTLTEALGDLDDWLLWQESQALFAQAQGEQIVEEIGFGD